MKEKTKKQFGIMRSAFMLIAFVLASLQVFAQREVTGVVKDANGEPLMSAQVRVKGTDVGTITDFDGNYTLTVPEGATTLEIAPIGVDPMEVAISGARVDVNFTKRSATDLDEVVVVGFGTGVARRDLVSTVTSISGNALKDIPVASAAEAMSGKLAGVQVTTTEGSPDADIKIRVRGGGSITGSSEPLYLVDGFPVDNISDIPPGNIKSIDVLKDASATAIYGARGANGVISVTTKDAGDGGRVTVNYSGFVGWKKIAKTLDVLDARDFALSQYERAAVIAGGEKILSGSSGQKSPFFRYFASSQEIYDAQKSWTSTQEGTYMRDNFSDIMSHWEKQSMVDWQDEIFGRTGFTSNHSVTLNGGNKTAQYGLTYNRVDDKAIMLGSDYQRNYLEFKLNAKPLENVKLSFKARYSDTHVTGSGATDATNSGGVKESRLRQTVRYMPYAAWWPLVEGESYFTNKDDEKEGVEAFDPYNPSFTPPNVYIYDNHKETNKTNYSYQGNVSWEIIKGLTAKSELGFDRTESDLYRFYGETSSESRNGSTAVKIDENNDGQINAGKPIVVTEEGARNRYRTANTLEWKIKSANKNHGFTTLLGHEFLLINDNRNVKTRVENLPVNANKDNALGYMNFLGVNRVESYPEYAMDENLLSFFGRVDYDYKSKYYATFTVRGDRSSKFASSGNYWGVFPSGVVSWRISDEAFMQPARTWLSNLKLRLSYGEVGNNDIASTLPYLTYESNGDVINPGMQIARDEDGYLIMPNPDIIWETMVTRNIGLDFGLFKNRVSGTLDLYWNSTKDLLTLFPIPGSGFDYQYRNIGSTSNKGVELGLNTIIVDKKDFGLDFNFNISYNKSRIDEYNGREEETSGWAANIDNDFLVREGKPLGVVYGYVYDGRYAADDFFYKVAVPKAGEIDASNGKWTFNNNINNPDASYKYTQDGVDKFGNPIWIDNNGNRYIEPDGSMLGNSAGPGALKLKDLDGDGKISDADKTIIGYTVPEITGGFTLSARYKQFDLAANFYYVLGNDIYNANKIDYTTLGDNESDKLRNMVTDMADGKRWTFIDSKGQFGEAGAYITDPTQLTELNKNTTEYNPFHKTSVLHSGMIEDGSFLRLSTLTVGYTLPQRWTSKLAISNMRVYFSGGNLFCLTNYSGYDPEADTRRKNPLTPGVDFSGYPKSRSYNVGLNLTF